MGLYISLARIIDSEVEKNCWLVREEAPELEPLFSKYIRIKHCVYPDEEYDLEVYFYEELDYLGKVVESNFYQDFENDKCLIDKSEVEKMWSYVVKEYKPYFKEHFVDKFKNGETIIIIGW